MIRQTILIISLTMMVGLGGCTSIKKLTGQTNDTVLPGQREDILPSDQQTARDPIVTGKQAPACDPKITTCPTDAAQ